MFLFSGFLLSTCKKNSHPAPGPPVVSFMDLNIQTTTLDYFHFKFYDSDGDIGLNPYDTSAPWASSTPYFYDFYMRFHPYDEVRKVFLDTFIIDNTLPPGHDTDFGIVSYRIPFVDNSKSLDGSLTGEVFVKLLGYGWPGVKHFRYDFYIYDRANNKSNVVTTPDFIVP